VRSQHVNLVIKPKGTNKLSFSSAVMQRAELGVRERSTLVKIVVLRAQVSAVEARVKRRAGNEYLLAAHANDNLLVFRRFFIEKLEDFKMSANSRDLDEACNLAALDGAAFVGSRSALSREEVSNDGERARRRLTVTLGLSCISQTNGRTDSALERQVAMGMEYIQDQSLALDLKLLFLTAPAVLIGRGAYSSSMSLLRSN
jgi:sugar transferase